MSSNEHIWVDDSVLEAIRALFEDPRPALAVLGYQNAGVPQAMREGPLDRAEPLLSRVRDLEKVLLDHLRLLAAQMSEFENPDAAIQLRGEALSVLISLRELHRHVPELDQDIRN